MASVKSSRVFLMSILYGTMFLFGFLENVKGVSYPLIKNEFLVSYQAQGSMISLLSVCYTFFVIASGFLLGRAGVKKVYIMGLVFALSGVASVYIMPGFWTVSISLLLLFAGFGVFEIAVNGAASRLFTGKTALLMSLLHFMYGLGAVLGPKAAGMLAGSGMGFRHIYLLTVPLVLLIFVPALFTRFPDADTAGPEAAAGEAPRFTAALRTPAVWLFGLTLGLMMGVEMASSNWGGLYFQDVYGMDPAGAGADFVAAFFAAFTLSRLVSGFLIEKIGYMRSLIGAVIAIGAVFALGFALGAKGIYVLPAAGFFIAVLWPTLMAAAIRFFGGVSAPVMTAGVIAIAGIVNAGMQLFMGSLNKYAGAAWGYRSCLMFTAVLLAILVRLNGMIRGAVYKEAAT